MSPTSIYDKLPKRHIRLLILQPGEAGSALHGRLELACIDNDPVYEALSYTWGAPEATSVLHCQGLSIPLTANLYDALSRLRLLDEVRILWVDQICIDQNDLAERSEQVSLMGEIYRGAEVVNIWLGEEKEDTELVIGFLPKLLSCFKTSEEGDRTTDELPDVIGTLGILTLRSDSWEAFRNIFQRPYFRRMWIVQEVVLGSKCRVYCGSYAMEWNDMARAALCFKTDTTDHFEALGVVQIIRGLKKRIAYGEDRSLLYLLSQTYDLQCANPRDKVYGLLGLTSDTHKGEITPDYNQTCQQIYIEAAKLCIYKYRSLAMLCCVRNPKGLSGLPSWIPDWNTVSHTRETLGFKPSEKYAAAGTTTPHFRISTDNCTLHVRGKTIDRIKVLGMPIWHSDIPDNKEVQEEWRTLARSASPYFTGEMYPTILWRLLLADGQTRGSESDELRRLLYEADDYYIRVHAEPSRQEEFRGPHFDITVTNTRALDFVDMYRSVVSGRRVAITEKGFLGLVLADAEVEDRICIFDGVQVPFVLRQDANSGSKGWHLVGECYLQGWMDGRCFENLESPGEEFEIS
ncbi:heterokaryon incompatibility protein-domain-containing protein [Tricladium varicosporioides]|nr:heterokaryon incompatibility protein-domain-containing protein [Hymenoscyphus varicosporioides]